MNRIKRISMQVLEKHPDLFSDNFDKNKESLTKVCTVRSKQLRNEIAGYITSYMRKQNTVEEGKEEVEEIEEIAE